MYAFMWNFVPGIIFSLFFGGQNVNLEGVCPLSLSEVPLYL